MNLWHLQRTGCRLCLLIRRPCLSCHAEVQLVKPGNTKGGTGHWPVSSGDPPDETEKRICLAIPPETRSAFLHAGVHLPGRARPVKPGKTKTITLPNQPETKPILSARGAK